jgi:amidase
MLNLSKTFALAALSSLLVACNDDNKDKTRAFQFNPVEASIADVHQAIQSRQVSCAQIVQSYLDRIQAYDKQGPTLNSIITTNPKALAEAAMLDQAYASNRTLKGGLHCVPVLAKDNIDTQDMPTTAGSPALAQNYAQDDAFIIQRIRAQGGIIIGKANLDEFAFGFTGKSSHPNGGQSKNAYDLSKGPGGSSSGTGTAIAASLAVVGIGTDTGGSIRIPSAVESLVGLRPSLRLVSQDGIIPLAPTQDTAGPMCRKVVDCAILMDALVGYDPSSTSNQRQDIDRLAPLLSSANDYQLMVQQPKTYVPANPNLKGKRIAVVTDLLAQPNNNGQLSEDGMLINQAMQQAITQLKAAGAIVEEVQIADLSTILSRYSSLSSYEFKTALTAYLKTTQSVFQSYDDLLNSGLMIASFSNYNRDVNDPQFMLDYAKNTLERTPFVRDRLNAALDHSDLNDQVLGASYDALAYPSMTALAANLGNGPSAGTNNRLSPFSGFPALSMPAARVTSSRSEQPMNVNIEFLAREFDEPTLFDIAAAFERVNPVRTAPVHTPAL